MPAEHGMACLQRRDIRQLQRHAFATRLGGIPANTMTNPTNDSPGAFAGESSTEPR